MKTNSSVFSTGWGLAFTAISALIINTHFLNTPAAAATDPTVSTLERTIYIEADAERQALGYEGYTLSPRAGGFRVEVVGSQRHEGTVLIDTDSTTWMSFEVTKGMDTQTFEFFGIGEPMGGVLVDDLVTISWFEDSTSEFVYVITGPIESSQGLTLLTDILSDDQFQDDFGNYQQIVAPVVFVVIGAIAAIAALTTAGVMVYNAVKAPAGPTPGEILVACAILLSACQADQYNPSTPACQEWLATCPNVGLPAPAPPPAGQDLIDACQELEAMCADPYHPYNGPGCMAYNSLGCAAILDPPGSN